MLKRVPYQQRPTRYEYLLTEKGRELFPILAAINRWGDRWLTSESGPPVVLRHTSCGHDTEAVVVCAHCHEPLRAEHITPRLGPGFPPRLRETALATGRFGDG